MNAAAHSHDDCVTVFHRLRKRGFELNSVQEACDVGPWMRFTPMLQALLFGLSTITGSEPVLLGLAAVLAIGLIVGVHPFDLIYSGVIRPLEKSPALPPSPVRRRMVFLIGIVFCVTTAWAFSAENMGLGYLLGGIMTASTTLLASTHICIPSIVMAFMGRFIGRRSEAT